MNQLLCISLACSLLLLVNLPLAWHPLLHLLGEGLDAFDFDVLHFGKDFLFILLQPCSLVVSKDVPQFALIHVAPFFDVDRHRLFFCYSYECVSSGV